MRQWLLVTKALPRVCISTDQDLDRDARWWPKDLSTRALLMAPDQRCLLLTSRYVEDCAHRISYVPKLLLLPRTAASFSSGVPVVRLLEANFGRSGRIILVEK